MLSNNPKKSKPSKTCDGSNITGKGVQYAIKYSAHASQHRFNIFLALYTDLRYIIMAADNINAYDQASNPYDTFYAYVDDQYRDL